MDEVKKYIDFVYLLAGALFAWLFWRVTLSVWNWFDWQDTEIFFGFELTAIIGVAVGVLLTVYLRVNPNIYGSMTEVGVELKKTIWPGREETKQNTLVVIAVTFVLGFTLAFFDLVWTLLTNVLYS